MQLMLVVIDVISKFAVVAALTCPFCFLLAIRRCARHRREAEEGAERAPLSRKVRRSGDQLRGRPHRTSRRYHDGPSKGRHHPSPRTRRTHGLYDEEARDLSDASSYDSYDSYSDSSYSSSYDSQSSCSTSSGSNPQARSRGPSFKISQRLRGTERKNGRKNQAQSMVPIVPMRRKAPAAEMPLAVDASEPAGAAKPFATPVPFAKAASSADEPDKAITLLSREAIEEIAEECFATDIAYDYDDLKTWGAQRVRLWFEGGGGEQSTELMTMGIDNEPNNEEVPIVVSCKERISEENEVDGKINQLEREQQSPLVEEDNTSAKGPVLGEEEGEENFDGWEEVEDGDDEDSKQVQAHHKFSKERKKVARGTDKKCSRLPNRLDASKATGKDGSCRDAKADRKADLKVNQKGKASKSKVEVELQLTTGGACIDADVGKQADLARREDSATGAEKSSFKCAEDSVKDSIYPPLNAEPISSTKHGSKAKSPASAAGSSASKKKKKTGKGVKPAEKHQGKTSS